MRLMIFIVGLMVASVVAIGLMDRPGASGTGGGGALKATIQNPPGD
ncbi:hypothetical protein [Rhizobium sp. BK251]|nr:hypothetical protein [Rhizobium sp. BK251]TCL70510.1 hypothetical protein EV286_107384 [Rhizobium sp. BK251]